MPRTQPTGWMYSYVCPREQATLKALLSAGGDEAVAAPANTRDDDGDRYPLHWAAARGRLRCAKLLLAAGADVALTDAAGHTPAALAREHRQSAVLELLLAHDGADVGDKGAASAAIAQRAEHMRAPQVPAAADEQAHQIV